MKGLFIVLEGPDGSGKSTMAKRIGEFYAKQGRDIVFTREPGGTSISEKIRDVLLDNNNKEMAYTTEALLYAASRAQHVAELIKPNLDAGKIVISERYFYSSIVYQGIGRGLGEEKVRDINYFAIDGVFPDLVLFFDIDPEKALNRKLVTGKGDRLENEKLSFHQEVFKGYKEIIDKYKEIKVINADKTPEELFEDIKLYIEKI